MQGLKAAVIFMGVVIVVMFATVVVTIIRRAQSPAAPPTAAAATTLNEPAGTHIAAMCAVGDRLAVLLQGGGPDRVVFLDGAGHVLAKAALPR
ncbi:MAG TPA: hypothetical protein VMB71_01270 [Acetobacteraceae bacterium]|nr:hypothetical protein [Acetobacteraceae bacterium]